MSYIPSSFLRSLVTGQDFVLVDIRVALLIEHNVAFCAPCLTRVLNGVMLMEWYTSFVYILFEIVRSECRCCTSRLAGSGCCRTLGACCKNLRVKRSHGHRQLRPVLVRKLDWRRRCEVDGILFGLRHRLAPGLEFGSKLLGVLLVAVGGSGEISQRELSDFF